MTVLGRSPLHELHESLGAKLVAFGGWEMPLSYPAGTIAEHNACRDDSALFDVSHLGTVRVSGHDALARLQSIFTNDLRKIAPGRAQYTHACNEAGGVEDDVIVWWVDDEVFDVMPNASNTSRIVDSTGGVDTTTERAVLAVQGPQARERLREFAPEAAEVGRFRVARVRVSGVPCIVAGTGYTGEDGVEIAVPREHSRALAEEILGAGVVPAGLGARDTLRLEAGLPLHGHELSAEITSLEADLGWVIGWDKTSFRGREALAAQRDRGVSRILCAVRTSQRRPPRDGGRVIVGGRDVGVVTSGNFSPTLGVGIALALVEPAVAAPGTAVSLVVRGSELPGEVVARPFVRR